MQLLYVSLHHHVQLLCVCGNVHLADLVVCTWLHYHADLPGGGPLLLQHMLHRHRGDDDGNEDASAAAAAALSSFAAASDVVVQRSVVLGFGTFELFEVRWGESACV